jgi:hypothetical protein
VVVGTVLGNSPAVTCGDTIGVALGIVLGVAVCVGFGVGVLGSYMIVNNKEHGLFI